MGSQGGRRRLVPQCSIKFMARGIKLDLEQRVKIFAPLMSAKVAQLVGNEWKAYSSAGMKLRLVGVSDASVGNITGSF